MKKTLLFLTAFLVAGLHLQGTALARFDWGSGFDEGDLNLKKNALVFSEKASTPSTPPANVIKIYAKDNGGTTTIYTLDDAGTETALGAGGGSGTPANPTKSIQYNNAGNFGGNSRFVYTSASNEVTLDATNTDQGSTLVLKGYNGDGNLIQTFMEGGDSGTDSLIGSNDLIFELQAEALTAPASFQQVAGISISTDGAAGVLYAPGKIDFCTATNNDSCFVKMSLGNDGLLTLGGNSYDGKLKLYSEDGATDHSTIFQPGTQTQDITYTLPVDDGAANDLLKTDGAGVLSWTAVTGYESALEAVLDLQDIQGAVTDAQVPNNITISLAALATNVSDAGYGDISVSAGVWSVDANSVALGTDTTGGYAASVSEAGPATTATALAANGTNCTAGNYPLGVDASGNAETCTAIVGGSEVNNLETITTGILTTEIPIGTAADTVVYAALSGDITMTNAGVVTIGADKVALATDTTGAYVANLSESTAIDVSGGGAENATVTVSWDSTEIEATTYGAGGNASNAWTFDLSGTDPVLTAVTGGFQMNDTLQLGHAGTDGKLTIYAEDGATDHSTIIQPGTQTQDITYTLPVDDGTSGQFMTTNGSGVLSWTTSSGSGDITDVFDCTSGDCNSITATDGDFLNFASINNSSTTEGFKLPQGTAPTGATAEGQIGWDTDDDILYVGNATNVVPINVIPMSSGGPGTSATRVTSVGPTMTPVATGSEASVDDYVTPTDCKMQKLTAVIDADPGGVGRSWDVTMADDGVGTALTCNIPNGSTSCTFTASQVSVGNGSKLYVTWTRNSTATSPGNMIATWECVPTEGVA